MCVFLDEPQGTQFNLLSHPHSLIVRTHTYRYRELSLERTVVAENGPASGIRVSSIVGTAQFTDCFLSGGDYAVNCGGNTHMDFSSSIVCGETSPALVQCSLGCSVAGEAGTCELTNFTRDCRDQCAERSTCVPTRGVYSGSHGGCPECGGPCDSSDIVATTDCVANSECSDGVGSEYSCACVTGFEGNGTVYCNDTNECTLGIDDCVDGSTCINTVGSYVCECEAGYKVSDGACVDINECLLAGSCGPGATCANTVGSYTCTCNRDFYGPPQGTKCTACPTNSGTPASGSLNLTDCECNYGFFRPGLPPTAPCGPCPPGYKLYGPNACAVCPENSYNNVSDSTVCVVCPSKSSTRGAVGADSLTDCICDPGYERESLYSSCSIVSVCVELACVLFVGVYVIVLCMLVLQ